MPSTLMQKQTAVVQQDAKAKAASRRRHPLALASGSCIVEKIWSREMVMPPISKSMMAVLAARTSLNLHSETLSFALSLTNRLKKTKGGLMSPLCILAVKPQYFCTSLHAMACHNSLKLI